MKILHILPELQIGGVERHVIDLANELNARGHKTMVVSAGGRMETQLDSGVQTLHLPVDKKNPFTGYYCACRIASVIREQRFDIIHAHSRVPAWIAMWASRMSGVPYVITAHSIFNTRIHWIYKPYRDAFCTICVSSTVREQMKDLFYDNTKVIVNGVKMPSQKWNKNNHKNNRFLFIGRITTLKGLQDVLAALPVDLQWTLDIVGDGPQKEMCQEICVRRGIQDRVVFHGYRDDVEQFMLNASCLLFPSHYEGYSLVAAQGALIGLPIMASDIPAVAELKGGHDHLIESGNIQAWEKALRAFLLSKTPLCFFPVTRILTLDSMVSQTYETYEDVLHML